MTNISRQPSGQPTGGQFAPDARAGASVALTSGATVEDRLAEAGDEEFVISDAFTAAMEGGGDGPAHDVEGIPSVTVTTGLDRAHYASAEIDLLDTDDAYKVLAGAAPEGTTDPRTWVDNNIDLIHDRLSEKYEGLDFDGGTLEDTYARVSTEIDPSAQVDQVPGSLRDETGLGRFQQDVASGRVWQNLAEDFRAARVPEGHRPSKVNINPVDDHERARAQSSSARMVQFLRFKDEDPRVPLALRISLDGLDVGFSEDTDYQGMNRALSTIEQVSPAVPQDERDQAWASFERHATSFRERHRD